VTRRVAVCRDPKDDEILSVALSAGVDAILSGDQDLLVLHPFGNIPILTVSAFTAI